jgi:hypothetical protein
VSSLAGAPASEDTVDAAAGTPPTDGTAAAPATAAPGETAVPADPPATPDPPPPARVVKVLDDDGGASLFALPAMAPATAYSRCIAVTYEGDAAVSEVSLQGRAEGLLARGLRLVVERGSGGGFDDCAGFTPEATLFDGTLETFAARHGLTDPGLGAFTATPDRPSRTFRFTFSAPEDPALAGTRAASDFLWTAQPG